MNDTRSIYADPLDEAVAQLSKAEQACKEGDWFVHRKSQTLVRIYYLGLIESNLEVAVIYREYKNGSMHGPRFIRPFKEFMDGRFERYSQSNSLHCRLMTISSVEPKKNERKLF